MQHSFQMTETSLWFITVLFGFQLEIFELLHLNQKYKVRH